MPIPPASPKPSDATETARILRKKSPLFPSDFATLDQEAKKRAFTVTDETSLDVIRDMRDALAKAKADGIEYNEFVKTVGPKLDAQWGIDSPQLKTIFVNNTQQAANQAIVARLNRQRGAFPYWTLDIVKDEVTSATCGYFITHPVVLPAGHPWFATNAPMRHHRCRTTLRGLTAAEARKIGITKEPPDWPADEGWGGSAPLGEYKANISDVVSMADKYAHITFVAPNGAKEEAKRGLEWRREHGRGGTAIGVARARDISNGTTLSPSTVRRMKAFFDRHQVDKKGKGFTPSDGFPSNGRIAWALWGGDPGYAWARKVVAQLNSADEKKKAMKDAKIKANNGQADVHQDGIVKVQKIRGKKVLPAQPAKMRAKLATGMPKKRTFKFAFARGGTRIEVRHMSDRVIQCASVEIDRTLLDDGPTEGGPPKLVWNQLTKLGSFRGHPAGPFEITPQINQEIVRNFRATHNQKIPIDFEHASEQDPTAGSIPSEGAPAQGWIHDLDERGAAGLWGLVEWLEPLRGYIRQGKYKFFSPAIRFGAKDRVTGQPIGARMTSGAATNNPFLDGMMPLAASDRGTGSPVATSTETRMTVKASDYAHSMEEMAPKLRTCLFDPGSHMASMGSVAECYDAVCRLEDLVDEFRDANPDADLMTAKHAGIDLGAALMRLRDAMQMGLGCTVPEMLAIVKAMIETAMGVHEDEMHTEEDPASSRDMRNTNMADVETTVKLREVQDKLATLMSEKAVLASEKAALDTKVAGLSLELKDRDATISTQSSELKTLRDNEAKRAAADESAAVDTAFATYKDTKKLTDLDKEQMLLTYRGNPDLFAKLYPSVAPDQRHLQRNLSNRQNAATQQNGVPPVAAPPAYMNQNAWNGSANSIGVQAPALQKRDYAEQLTRLSDAKVKTGMPREQAIVEARRELTQAPAVLT